MDELQRHIYLFLCGSQKQIITINEPSAVDCIHILYTFS